MSRYAIKGLSKRLIQIAAENINQSLPAEHTRCDHDAARVSERRLMPFVGNISLDLQRLYDPINK